MEKMKICHNANWKNLHVVGAISDPPETLVALALSAKARPVTGNWKLVP